MLKENNDQHRSLHLAQISFRHEDEIKILLGKNLENLLPADLQEGIKYILWAEGNVNGLEG